MTSSPLNLTAIPIAIGSKGLTQGSQSKHPDKIPQRSTEILRRVTLRTLNFAFLRLCELNKIFAHSFALNLTARHAKGLRKVRKSYILSFANLKDTYTPPDKKNFVYLCETFVCLCGKTA